MQMLETRLENSRTVQHAASASKLGTRNGKPAVVDTTAKTFGVHGLGAVDASDFPLLPPGHPTSAVKAVAEEVAEGLDGALI